LNSWTGYYSNETIEEPMSAVMNRGRLAKFKSIYTKALSEIDKIDTKAEGHVSKIITELSNSVSFQQDKSLKDVIASLKENAKKYKGKAMFGTPIGIPIMDGITKGMQPGHLWILGAYTSMGKSWFAIRIMREFLRENKGVLYISLEMSAEEILWRLAVQDMENSIDLFHAKTKEGLTKDQLEMIDEEFNLIEDYPLTVLDSLSNFDEMRLSILHYIHAKKVSCIVVDYVQNVVMPKSQSEYDGLNRLILELQTIARKNQIFMLALSQVNRESQRAKDTTVFGFKGSGNLENAADIAITISSREEDPNVRQLVIGKNREGMTGQVTCDVDLSRGLIKQCPIQYV
jgi:replicative DNA helicase